MFTREKLEDIVKEGLVQDIFKMEQSYSLMKTIGEKSNELKGETLSSFNQLFGTIQNALQTEAILAAARIYDNPSNKFPTRCLRGVLKFLAENSAELPQIREPYQLTRHLKLMNAHDDLVKIATDESVEFAHKFSIFIDNLLNEPARKIALNNLKLFRDKVLAHNEQVDSKIVGPTWASLKDLIDIAKNVVGILGWAYFSVAYVIDGKYILSNDTLITSNALKRLFNLIRE